MIMRKFDYNLIDEIVTKYTYVSLNDNDYYMSNIIVGSVQMKLTCAYNSLNKQRWISLTDVSITVCKRNQVVLVVPTPIKMVSLKMVSLKMVSLKMKMK